MIQLSNGKSFDFMVASGSLAFDGMGWPHERPLVWLGLIEPSLFAVVLKSLTFKPRKGNFNWLHPWTCIRLVRSGSVNAVGLTNPGAERWLAEIAPKIDYEHVRIIVSLFGSKEELVAMVQMFNHLPIAGYEINLSCPNTKEDVSHNTKASIESVLAVRENTHHPIGIKLSYDQDYLAIANGLEDVAEWISVNSVRWTTVFPDTKSPLARLGGGAVSGKPAQSFNWKVAMQLTQWCSIPVVWPSIMDEADLRHLRKGARVQAVSFGAIHFRNPCLPTKLVRQELEREGQVNENDLETFLKGR